MLVVLPGDHVLGRTLDKFIVSYGTSCRPEFYAVVLKRGLFQFIGWMSCHFGEESDYRKLKGVGVGLSYLRPLQTIRSPRRYNIQSKYKEYQDSIYKQEPQPR